MKQYRNLTILVVLLLTIFASCEKDNNNEPEKNQKQIVWSISQISAKVELKGETDIDQESIEQMENEIKAKTTLIGDLFTFTYTLGNSNTGQLKRTFNGTEKKIVSDFLTEKSKDNALYLKIISNGVVIDSFQIVDNYIIKDFSKEYKQIRSTATTTDVAAR